jgi:predicted O-linked N-acetylglucosamine transferase (SPINDLY family)
MCYAKPVIPSSILNKSRTEFGLRNEAVVYICSQAIYKVLPEQDRLFAEIARQLPLSQFVFLTPNDFVRRDFERRLERAFGEAGLCAAEHCVSLPELPLRDYWNLHRVSDVFLDTLGWSGGVSTIEAIICGLPIMTMPGRTMRGRQSAAILTQLGVVETIARDENEYVGIAVRLGQDRNWREGVLDRMAAGYEALFSDTRCVRALEDFYLRAVADKSG